MTKTNQKTIEGIIAITSRGTGYVTVPDFDNDIEIPAEDVQTALHRDTVRVELKPARKSGRQQGVVVEVLERAQTRFVGTLEKKDGAWHLLPDNSKIHVDFSVAGGKLDSAKVGYKALVRLVAWDDPKALPAAELLETIGKAGEHETEMQAVVLARGFAMGFPPEVEEEAAAIGKNKNEAIQTAAKDRRDFRETTTFTIDPDDAKDFDDALSLKKNADGTYEVGVHIADVSHYVTPGSALDDEAQERGTSIYLVDRTIPMLPEVLSNDVCSLKPHEDRLAFSAVFTLDKNAKVKDKWFGKTVIHSDHRFAYEGAQKVLDTGTGQFADELSVLNDLSKKLRAERMRHGGIDFDQDEVKFVLDKNGKPIDVIKKERLDANMLIEDFMLLANREVALHVYNLCKNASRRDATFVYRIHDAPHPERIEELGVFVRAIGYEFETSGGDVDVGEIKKLFSQIEGTPEEELIKTATIRSMAKAVYSTKNIGHFGLSFRYYTHFTSPIRRYPDIMVHRILYGHLNGSPVSSEELARYERLAIQSSEQEALAVEAERESIKYKQVEYMKEHVGETFKAVVSGVTEFGIFVEEKETKAEGLVRMGKLTGDYFVYQKDRYRVVGQQTGKKFQLGDEVSVRLVAADLDEKRLDFELAKSGV